ncbi:MAG: nuclear transport factor 2 family protein [Trebonia sp.]
MAARPSDIEAHGTSKLRVAEEFFACVEQGDFAGMRACYAPNATVWHNDGLPEQTLDENIALVTAVASVLSGLRYDVIRRAEVEDGVYTQHVLCGDLPDGTELRVDAVMFLHIANDRIHRVEEYFDSRQVDHLSRALASG